MQYNFSSYAYVLYLTGKGEKKRNGERVWSCSHLLVHCPKHPQNWHWTSAKSGNKNPVQLSYMAERILIAWSITAFPHQLPWQEVWVKSWDEGVLISIVNTSHTLCLLKFLLCVRHGLGSKHTTVSKTDFTHLRGADILENEWENKWTNCEVKWIKSKLLITGGTCQRRKTGSTGWREADNHI